MKIFIKKGMYGKSGKDLYNDPKTWEAQPKSKPKTVQQPTEKKYTSHKEAPKVTGNAQNFKLGHTRSGKSVMSFAHDKGHKEFSQHDHIDAYYAHAKHVSGLKDAHPKLIEHHKEQMLHHWKMAHPDVNKAVDHKAEMQKHHDSLMAMMDHMIKHGHSKHAGKAIEHHAKKAHKHHKAHHRKQASKKLKHAKKLAKAILEGR